MTATDWRTYDTPEARSAFLEAQTRLDHVELQDDGTCTTWGVEHYTHEMAEADEKLADRFDRMVLQSAHDEFDRQCEEDEFNRHYPEPPDGSRIEFEFDRGARYAAYRMDEPERDGGTWWMYGTDEQPRTWRQMVGEFELRMDDVELLQFAEQTKPAHDPSQPTPPLPLAEDDTVTVTMPARVAGLPDPEADPGAADELWDFAITVAGETEYVSLTQAEVIARVRKP